MNLRQWPNGYIFPNCLRLIHNAWHFQLGLALEIKVVSLSVLVALSAT
ncbi:DUF3265 domain-containing protein [Vibrio lentus]|nr:DUF3265 domain-containing protein [Vibrio lentus]